MATQEGLEDQMLGIAVAMEEPELEVRREQLVLEDAGNKRVQKEIEDTILDLLKNSEGNILDDEASHFLVKITVVQPLCNRCATIVGGCCCLQMHCMSTVIG
jgi:ATP-binding dynein motor region